MVTQYFCEDVDKITMGRFLPAIIILFIIFSLSGDIKRFTETGFAQRFRGEKTEHVIVKNILSGDSFRTTEGQIVRLSGVSAPPRQAEGGKEAMIGLWRLIRPGTPVKLYLDGYDTRGRTLARVEREDGLKVQVILVQERLAKPYTPPSEDAKEYAWAEELAFAQTAPLAAAHKRIAN